MDGMMAWRDGVGGSWRRDRARTVQVVVASLMIVLIGLGALLVWRRVAGAVGGPLPAGMLIEAWLVVGALVLGGRFVWFREALSRPPRPIFDERRDEFVEAIVTWGGSLAIAWWAIGCSFGERWGDWLLWVALIGVDQGELWWLHFRRVRCVALRTASEMERSVIPPLAPPFKGGGFEGIPPLAPRRRGPSTTFEGGGCEVQHLVQVRGADGVEVVRGRLRAEFVAGQRQAVLNVGFCPPLVGAPIVEAAVAPATADLRQVAPGAYASGSGGAEVRVVQAFCHGARLEVRLAEAATRECAVMVEVSAKPQTAAGLRHAAEGGMARG